MTNQAQQEKREAQLKEWNAKATELEARMEKAMAEAKIASEDEKKDLMAKRDALKKKLKDYRNASEDAADDVKSGLQQAWQSLNDALDRAKARF